MRLPQSQRLQKEDFVDHEMKVSRKTSSLCLLECRLATMLEERKKGKGVYIEALARRMNNSYCHKVVDIGYYIITAVLPGTVKYYH